MTAVAKTSKKPSTQRWTTHQRQYSTIDRCVCWPQVRPGAVEQADGAGGEQEERTAGCRCSPASCSAGQHGADHQEQPEQQADEQEDLPDPAEVDVLVALWPQ